jgi:hypothetical protein
MFVLPPHVPCDRTGLGEVDAAGVARCIVRRTWRLTGFGWEAVDGEGCGIEFRLCPAHGLWECASCRHEPTGGQRS